MCHNFRFIVIFMCDFMLDPLAFSKIFKMKLLLVAIISFLKMISVIVICPVTQTWTNQFLKTFCKYFESELYTNKGTVTMWSPWRHLNPPSL